MTKMQWWILAAILPGSKIGEKGESRMQYLCTVASRSRQIATSMLKELAKLYRYRHENTIVIRCDTEELDAIAKRLLNQQANREL